MLTKVRKSNAAKGKEGSREIKIEACAAPLEAARTKFNNVWRPDSVGVETAQAGTDSSMTEVRDQIGRVMERRIEGFAMNPCFIGLEFKLQATFLFPKSAHDVAESSLNQANYFTSTLGFFPVSCDLRRSVVRPRLQSDHPMIDRNDLFTAQDCLQGFTDDCLAPTAQQFAVGIADDQ